MEHFSNFIFLNRSVFCWWNVFHKSGSLVFGTCTVHQTNWNAICL